MKSEDQELERLFATARQAQQDESSAEMPFGFATRVLSHASEKKNDFLTHANRLVRWSIGVSVALIVVAAVFSFSDSTPEPTAFAAMEIAAQHEFTNLVLQR
ncbi:MAG: hypothetical protein ACI8T1_002745 [Verrucomicrobiales bacterium]|jgi:hypothetical protein